MVLGEYFAQFHLIFFLSIHILCREFFIGWLNLPLGLIHSWWRSDCLRNCSFRRLANINYLWLSYSSLSLFCVWNKFLPVFSILNQNPAELDDWLADLNPQSKELISGAYATSLLQNAAVGDKFQFERLGRLQNPFTVIYFGYFDDLIVNFLKKVHFASYCASSFDLSTWVTYILHFPGLVRYTFKTHLFLPIFMQQLLSFHEIGFFVLH